MDLELKRKVEIHELEERINKHINDLMKNHEKSFVQIKNYYNDITKDNLNLIKSLKVNRFYILGSNCTARSQSRKQPEINARNSAREQKIGCAIEHSD